MTPYPYPYLPDPGIPNNPPSPPPLPPPIYTDEPSIQRFVGVWGFQWPHATYTLDGSVRHCLGLLIVEIHSYQFGLLQARTYGSHHIGNGMYLTYFSYNFPNNPPPYGFDWLRAQAKLLRDAQPPSCSDWAYELYSRRPLMF